MNTIELARAARAAGVHPLAYSEEYLPGLERLVALARAAEREACAKVCEDEAEKWEGDDGPISTEARLCAINIRARGEK